eukprot:1824630-Rhodomonas_salina.2
MVTSVAPLLGPYRGVTAVITGASYENLHSDRPHAPYVPLWPSTVTATSSPLPVPAATVSTAAVCEL